MTKTTETQCKTCQTPVKQVAPDCLDFCPQCEVIVEGHTIEVPKEQGKEEKLDVILDAIYGGGMTTNDYCRIITRIRQALDDSFYEEAPSSEQFMILRDLQFMASKVRDFYR